MNDNEDMEQPDMSNTGQPRYSPSLLPSLAPKFAIICELPGSFLSR